MGGTTTRWAAVAVAASMLAIGCSGDDPSSESNADKGGETAVDIEITAPEGCDFLDQRQCLLPFPSDHYTVPDDETPTGLRVDLPAEGMPVNGDDIAIDPTEWNRNDGFSPGATLLTHVPGVDLEASGIPPITDMGRSLEDDSAVVVVDAETGERHPVWGELDARADSEDERLLIVRPAVDFVEGHRYVVGLRSLVDEAGEPIEAGDEFRAYRDEVETDDEAIEARRDDMDDVLGVLDEAGVERGGLYLAWDFTVASQDGLSGRLLHMRDESFADMGDGAPAFEIESVSGEVGTGRTVSGTYSVPNWLTGTGDPGATLNNADDPNGIPSENGAMTVPFLCAVPAVKTDEAGATVPADASLYGHGLLGSRDEVLSVGPLFGGATNTVFCATDWIGMSSGDLANVGTVLTEMSNFGSIPDRLQQSHLNFLHLGRLLKSEAGFGTNPAFQDGSGASMLSGEVVFVGNSQGGILGGATSAVAQDWEHSVLGVPGMNYSTLLDRSIDFDQFTPVFEAAYPSRLDRVINLGLVQMLWDRGENNGYAQHLTTDPYPGTPAKQVLLFEAFGDHQVANVATETMARTIGARLRLPALADGRSPDVEPFWRIEGVEPPAGEGSFLVVWDFDTPPPPIDNTPPRDGDDPHGKGSEVPEVLIMASAFLKDGSLTDVCGGEPCHTPEG